MRRTGQRIVTGGAVALSVMAVPAVAFAEDLGRAIDGLSTSNVFVSDFSSNAPSGLESAYSGTNVAVVFLGDSTNTTADAQQILANSNYETVIVSVNGQVFGAASKVPGAADNVSAYLNENGAQALVTDASAVTSMATTTTTTETGSGPLEGDSGALGTIGTIGGILVAVIALVAVGAFVLRKLTKNNRNEKVSTGDNDELSSNLTSIEYYTSLSADFAEQVAALRSLVKRHQDKGLYDGAGSLAKLDKRLSDFFERLKVKGTDDQRQTAAIKYADLLKKVIYIMDEHHYMDVVLHPELWNNADVRKQNSLAAVNAVDEQVLDNIRQLNDSQNLDFNVTMQALLTNSDDLSGLEELMVRDDTQGYHNSVGGF